MGPSLGRKSRDRRMQRKGGRGQERLGGVSGTEEGLLGFWVALITSEGDEEVARKTGKSRTTESVKEETLRVMG